LFRAGNVFKLAIREKSDTEVNPGVLLHPLSLESFIGSEELRVPVPFAVMGLSGIVEVLGIVKQRHFAGDMAEQRDDTIFGDKFEERQQIIFARPEISRLGQIGDISCRRATLVFLNELFKDMVADAAQEIDLRRNQKVRNYSVPL
jgi:hypothetical protein